MENENGTTQFNAPEEVVAVIGTVGSEPPAELTHEVACIQNTALGISVIDDKSYGEAAEMGKSIKAQAAKVKEFFKPLKDAAFQSHRMICDQETKMLKPLESAETVLKSAMSSFITEKQRRQKEVEDELRRKAKEEADKKIAEAVALAALGRKDEAESKLNDAAITESVSNNISFAASTPKVDGVSTSKDWTITNIDQKKVPTEISGIIIRPVDKAQILKLIRMSKGTIKIEGIDYKEETKISLRK